MLDLPDTGTMTPLERETFLHNYVVEYCKSYLEISFEEMVQVFQEFGIAIISKLLVKLLNEEENLEPFGNKAFASLYTLSFKLCVQAGHPDYSEMIYNYHNEQVEKFLATHMLPTMLEKRENLLIRQFSLVWDKFILLGKWMYKLFFHLDGGYVMTSHVPTISSSSLKLFFTTIFTSCQARIVDSYNALIAIERSGLTIDRDILRSCTRIFEIMGLAANSTSIQTMDSALKMPSILGIYTQYLEVPLLAQAQCYFALQSNTWVNEQDIVTYVRETINLLATEEQRVDDYLNKITKEKMRQVFYVEMVATHSERLVEAVTDAFKSVFDFSGGESAHGSSINKEHLGGLASLFIESDRYSAAAVPVTDQDATATTTTASPAIAVGTKEFTLVLSAKLLDYIVSQGDMIIDCRKAQIQRQAEEALTDPTKKESVNDSDFIENSIRFYDVLYDMVANELQNLPVFHKALKDGLLIFANKEVGKFSQIEMLAAYFDRLLKGAMKMSEAELEHALDKCLKIFNHVIEKDVFVELYRDCLSKRLLNKRESISMETEKMVIGKMKMQCGSQFTSKLEGMITDMTISSDVEKEFDAYFSDWKSSRSRSLQSMSFCPLVLTTGFWPSHKDRDLHIPAEMATCQQTFKEWYDNKHQHRKLTWSYTLGELVVRATIGKTAYDLTVTPIQGVVLWQFHRSCELITFQRLQEMSGISEAEVLKRVLHSLSCQKHKILCKSTTSKNVSTTESFQFNMQFKNPLKKFRIPMASLDDVNVVRNIEEDRTVIIEAAAVRIMKARRQLSHQDLVGEIIRQLSTFKPNSAQIKRRIEALIEREYLQRDPNNPTLYNYLA